ncbi:TetM/TetW/TetO/TetS family tetracycline resistance ribosomal protection protein [Faecalimonas hominis]
MKSNKLTIGILAHVDAGKTTLAESILYTTGHIRKLGRVDHKNAFLDTDALERSRGITIFSKQANFVLKEKEITLLDTPGHIDFSAEMERTLQVLDYAILVISGADGVQSHVQTLWKLLKKYNIPVFLFVNKMDQQGTDKKRLIKELQNRLNEHCIAFDGEEAKESFMENVAMCDELLLEKYLETESISRFDIQKLIENRKLFPCYFGSALKLEGIETFLEGIYQYTDKKDYGEEFGAKVYKISRNQQGNRLSHLKITGGTLKVKEKIKEDEKVEQIRIYSGTSYQAVNEVAAGTICAVMGLTSSKAGEGLGKELQSEKPMLEPVLTYRIQFPEGSDIHGMFLNLKQLEEEEPELHIVRNKESGEIHAQVMGEIQLEILKSLISERFHTDVSFGQGQIIYKETIKETVEGAGHFEPLRHYAEVRLRLEPAKLGSGLHFSTECSEDILNRNWQRLILTHLEEKQHRGVLTGSEVTDMNIILTTGKAHIKHTEGGDFRQATYRAVRQGLKRAESILLEPVYEYRLEIPSEMVGRAMSDLQRMQADFSLPESEGEISVLTGTAPVVHMQEYQKEVLAYTKGHGRLFCSLRGYEPCHNAEEVIEKIQYDSESDLENPTGSVFCSHGAGFNVSWDNVEEYMHTSPQEKKTEKEISHQSAYLPPVIDEEELLEIFERTYGPVKRKKNNFKKQISSPVIAGRTQKKKEYDKEYLLVDGYNIIFAWEDLKELSEVNIEGARNKLMDILSNYQGYRQCTLILVFDAYKVPGNVGEVQKYHNIHVVYTKEAETADQYIEKTVHELGKHYKVTVATSDGLEQMIIMGQGANRLSAKGLLEEILIANEEIRKEHLNQPVKNKQYLFDNVSEDMAEYIEQVRKGE